MGPALVQMTFGFGGVILVEAALSFLGLGPQVDYTWGAMLDQARTFLWKRDWVRLYALVPGLAIMWVVLGANLLGDGLRDRARSAPAREGVMALRVRVCRLADVVAGELRAFAVAGVTWPVIVDLRRRRARRGRRRVPARGRRARGRLPRRRRARLPGPRLRLRSAHRPLHARPDASSCGATRSRSSATRSGSTCSDRGRPCSRGRRGRSRRRSRTSACGSRNRRSPSVGIMHRNGLVSRSMKPERHIWRRRASRANSLM